MLKNILNTENAEMLYSDIRTYTENRYNPLQNRVKRYIQIHFAEMPYFKNFFDNLADKKEYSLYKEMVLSDDKYISFFDSAIEELGCDALDIINVQCIALTYIGFSVEAIVINTMYNCNIPTKANSYLDNVKKTDILINDSVYLQIKNTSFLDSQYLDTMVFKYKKANSQLHFLFWDIDKGGNVAFRKVNGRLFLPIDEICGFDILDTDTVTPQTFYDEFMNITKGEV